MTEKEKQEGALNNLKSIYSVQKSGSIQVMIRDVRASKDQLEDAIKSIKEQRKNIATTKTEKQDKSVAVFDLPEVAVVEDDTAVKESAKNTKNAPDNAQKKDLGNKQFNQNQNKKDFIKTDRPDYKKRDFNNNDFASQRKFGDNKPNKPFNSSNPRFNNNFQKSNNAGQKPFGPRQQGQQKPFEKKFGQNGGHSFVSTKSNAFKVFAPTESSSVLSQPERNYGNKNKSNRNLEEKKQINKKALLRKNIIVEDSYDDEDRMGNRKLAKKKKEQKTFVAPQIESAVITTQDVTVKTLSEKTGKPVTEIIKKLMMLGIMATINSSIDFMTAELVSSELGVKLEQKLEKSYEEQLMDDISEQEDEQNMVKRPPVVTVMGHVDHGKTSLLDAIRKTNVVGGEAGGITQKIGAYQVTFNGEKITFIDTPGHAAFTAMRARGAEVTDIAILVVAADDGIMPQTIEAINHIKAANVPMIVAVNKIDKPEANIDKVKQQLAENGVLPEEWGGDAIIVPVSAKKNIGIDDLLQTVLLVAEVSELKANPNQTAVGTVIEAELDKTKGAVATILVQSGTLKVGDSIMSGISFGKVRAMFDENGKNVKVASPSTPVAVLGLDSVPNSGDRVFAVDEKLSKQVIQERIAKAKEVRANSTSGVSLEDFMDRVNEGKLKALNIIIKADVQGSVEALKQSLTAIKNEEAKVVCIHSGAGAVTESDLVLAQASGAVIINFNLKLGSKIEQMADSMGVQVKSYKVIYEVVDEITKALNGMLSVKYENVYIGKAEVRAMFKLSTSGVVCGCYILDGKAIRNAIVHVYRGDERILETEIQALRIQKDDKAEVNYGYECGIKLKDSTGVQVDDKFEIFQKVEIKRG